MQKRPKKVLDSNILCKVTRLAKENIVIKLHANNQHCYIVLFASKFTPPEIELESQ